MKKFFDSLSEKDKRRYAAIEAMRLGHGHNKFCLRQHPAMVGKGG